MSWVLVLVLVLASTCACSDSPDSDTSLPEATETDSTPVAEGLAEYRIVYERSIGTQATKIKNKVKQITGKAPEYTYDTNAAPTNREILIGDTGRDESTEFISSLEPYSYGVKLVGEKVVIAAVEKEYLPKAVELFISDYLPKAGNGIDLIKSDDTVVVDEEAKMLDEIAAAQKIQWEEKSSFFQNGGYARMTTLPDGKLACVYSGGGYIRFCTSNDDGKTWNSPVNIIKIDTTPTNQKMTLANANIIVMNDGSYMVAFRAHTAGDTFSEFYTSIRYCISKDNGQTWSADTIVAENTHKGSEYTGFWEPHMIYIKDGRLAMYYSSDCIGGTAEGYPFVKNMTYQHIIMHIYNEKAEHFGEPIIASNGEDHNSRDGMPIVCKLADGSYAMVIESSSMRGSHSFIIQIMFSEDGINWSTPRNIWVPKGNGHYAGAPFIVTLPDGRIAVSFQATEGSGMPIYDNNVNSSVMNVIISNKPIGYGDKDTIEQGDFERIYFNPFDDHKNAHSIWPGMHVHNGKLYCCADIGAATSKGIYLIKGTIKQAE